MKQILFIFCFLSILNLFADWDPGEPAKWVQLPNVDSNNGLAVSLTPGRILADDFLCTETGPITEIHIWGMPYVIAPDVDPTFIISIHADIPADQSPTGYSMPGENLWFSVDHLQTERVYEIETTGHWYDPYIEYYTFGFPFYCWQFNLGPFDNPFVQQGSPAAPTVYWLVVQLLEPLSGYELGWLSSLDHWNDDAVWEYPAFRQEWQELIYPIGHLLEGQSIDLAFVIEGDDQVPVELSSFSAAYSNGMLSLFWTTQSESNNIGWNVYRAENEDMEESIQINVDLIPGAGTTSQPTDYVFDDEYEVEVNQQYFYWLESIDNLGYTDTYGPISLTIPEDGEDPGTPEIPDIYGLHQNYPNPFNPETRISYRMREDCVGTLRVYNLKGEEIVTLFENRAMSAEEKGFVDWDGLDKYDNAMPSGVYIYELDTDKSDHSRKMVLAK